METSTSTREGHNSQADFAARENYARHMHRRQQLRRAMLLGTVVAVVGLGTIYFGSWVQHYRAVAALAAAGFTVDWHPDPEHWPLGGSSAVHNSRISFFDHLHDDDLKPILKLTNVEELMFAERPIPEPSLAILRSLPLLKELDLSRTNHYLGEWGPEGLRDSVLDSVRGLSHLRRLSLAGNLITDEGLRTLSGLKELEELDLTATEITDAGLAQLKGFPRLSTIRLGATRATAEGIKKLKAMIPGAEISEDVDPEVERGVLKWRQRQQ